MNLISFGTYGGPLATLIKNAKSQPWGRIPKVYQNISRALCEHWKGELNPADLITFVPGQPFRCLIQSDFSESIALTLGEILNLPVSRRLIRRKWSSPQRKLINLDKRKTTLSGDCEHFQLPLSPYPKGSRVLLVDDVCTTGSSLKACTRLLRSAGYEVSQCLTFARSPRFFYECKDGRQNEDYYRALSH
ncbi:ComF family protein [bacterium]|nr:ComF family protein [bacterium]